MLQPFFRRSTLGGCFRERSAILLVAALVFVISAGAVTAQEATPAEIEFWQSVRDSKDPLELEAYLKSYPGGKFAELAKLRLEKLRPGNDTRSPAEKAKQPNSDGQTATPEPKPTDAGSASSRQQELYRSLDFFGDVLERVRSDYVDKPDVRSLFKNAIAGLQQLRPTLAPSPLWAAANGELEALSGDDQTVLYRALDIFGNVLERVRSETHGTNVDRQLIETAVMRMLTSLDPRSEFIPPGKFRAMQTQTRGEHGGVGMELTMESGIVMVVSPIAGSPGEKAGIRAGDLITLIDGKQTRGMRLEQAVEALRGPVNSVVKLTVVRKGSERELEVSVKRNIVRIDPVVTRAERDVGYIRITTFNEQTLKRVQEGLGGLKKRIGRKLKGFVIDLRNCPGGLLDLAIAVADEFLDAGTIMTTRGRGDKEAQRSQARPGDIAEGKKLVVLIDRGTAAGAEILAGALQDHKRATIVGERSRGLGTIQTIIPLGSNGAIRLTTARWYTPNVRSIHGQGIEPDLIVTPSTKKGEDTEMAAALGIIRGKS